MPHKGKGDYPGKEKAQAVATKREKEKEERSDRAKKLLKEKGEEMNKSEKAFVSHFVKKDK